MLDNPSSGDRAEALIASDFEKNEEIPNIVTLEAPPAGLLFH